MMISLKVLDGEDTFYLESTLIESLFHPEGIPCEIRLTNGKVYWSSESCSEISKRLSYIQLYTELARQPKGSTNANSLR